MKNYILALIVMLLASGCMTKRYYPLPVNENTQKLQGLVDGESENIIQGLNPAEEKGDAIKQMHAYAAWYLHMSSQYKTDEYIHDDISLGFGLAGLVAGVLESPEGAALGALLASGAKLPVNRYELAVQSANYEQASDAMHCMYQYLMPFENNETHIPNISFLNSKIYDVRRQLRKVQSQIILAAPDKEDLKEKLTTIINFKPDTSTAEAEIKSQTIQMASFKKQTDEMRTAQKKRAIAEQEIASVAIKKAEHHLELCVTNFSK